MANTSWLPHALKALREGAADKESKAMEPERNSIVHMKQADILNFAAFYLERHYKDAATQHGTASFQLLSGADNGILRLSVDTSRGKALTELVANTEQEPGEFALEIPALGPFPETPDETTYHPDDFIEAARKVVNAHDEGKLAGIPGDSIAIERLRSLLPI